MQIKWIGAMLIIAASGGYGFSIAAAHSRQEGHLAGLLRAIEYMCCALEYQAPELPALCAAAAPVAGGMVGTVFSSLAIRLEESRDADAGDCMEQILLKFPKLSPRVTKILQQFGMTLGRFSLSGQISLLRSAAGLCRRELQSLQQDRHSRLRSYRTLGLCAGAALVILLI